MNTSDESKSILLNFFSAMNKWEKDNYIQMREGGVEEQKKALDEINAIFLKFCTIRDRKVGRQASLHCGEPPEYDVDNQPIVNIESKGKKNIIYTEQMNRLKNKYRYTLNYKNDEWRIDKKERFSPFEDKWIKDSL
ncbi:NTF2 fold immunity protein [Rosenbergiella epipactidis]|uniref:NTF2 fold immunity protein n=1 Tax=Rosenbergiella epipactidis TaxID=1544694 RepID=UPI001F4D43CE|nr:NTF2 fold immunity protein [Rosenbergiella epipactidis]